MKKIMSNKIKTFLLTTGAFMSACGDKFVDLQPISSSVVSNFYKTSDDIKVAVNGIYASLQKDGISKNNYIFGEISSDNTTPVSSGTVTDQDEFDRFYIRTTNPYVSGRWNDGYNAISRVNTVLSKIDAVDMDQELKKRYIAEIKFIRAYVYFELVRTFGDIPLILKPVDDPLEGYNYVRSPISDIYIQIETDLTEAESDLPASYSGSDIGRITQGADLALLGKVYMTEHKYDLAIKKLEGVVETNQYDLLPNYGDIFKATGKNHVESIFDIQFMGGGAGEGNPWPNWFAPQNSGNAVIKFGGGGNNRPTQDLIGAYEAGDKRKDLSLATSYVNESGNTIQDVYVKKYYDVPATNGDNGNNIPIIRFADILLMYAECLNELKYESDGKALTALNRVRIRAGLAGRKAGDLKNQESFKLAIEQERRVELAFEGHRWFDLVRTGRAIEVINAKKDQIRLVAELDDHNLVFPIPQAQIDINKSKINQNIGY